MRHTAWTTILLASVALAAPALSGAAWADQQKFIDAHVHYSHDAWDRLPPEAAVKILRDAGLSQVFVSSSSDEGTQRLYRAAPDLIVPVLRPYRSRGELSTWFRDPTAGDHVEARLKQYRYAGIGEFHIFGADADSDVMRRLVKLAAEYKLFLHAHGDADAVRRLFAQDPQARILWAHSGFVAPTEVRQMLETYPTLRADLAFRNDHAADGRVDPAWRALFEAFPDRFMAGTDTFTPERWYYIGEHAKWTRAWLADLPAPLADNIAWRNATALARWQPPQ